MLLSIFFPPPSPSGLSTGRKFCDKSHCYGCPTLLSCWGCCCLPGLPERRGRRWHQLGGDAAQYGHRAGGFGTGQAGRYHRLSGWSCVELRGQVQHYHPLCYRMIDGWMNGGYIYGLLGGACMFECSVLRACVCVVDFMPFGCPRRTPPPLPAPPGPISSCTPAQRAPLCA